MCFYLLFQSPDSSDEESLHIDTEAKTEVKGRNSKVSKNKGGSSAGILDLLQASKQVGGIDYSNNRYTHDCFPYAYERLIMLIRLNRIISYCILVLL